MYCSTGIHIKFDSFDADRRKLMRDQFNVTLYVFKSYKSMQQYMNESYTVLIYTVLLFWLCIVVQVYIQNMICSTQIDTNRHVIDPMLVCMGFSVQNQHKLVKTTHGVIYKAPLFSIYIKVHAYI